MSGTYINDGQTVLLDTVILIYYLERNPRFGDTAEKYLKRIESGVIGGVISTLLFAELLVPPFRNNDHKTASGVVSRLSNFRNLQVLNVDLQTSITAARLRAKYGLRTPDAVHAATALTAGADGILTNDKKMKRLEKENLNIWLIDQLS